MPKFLRFRYARGFNFATGTAMLFLVASICPAEEPAPKANHPRSFDPASGFKPALTDLTKIFLQIAGSLESFGSPIPYLQHVKAQDDKIAAAYAKKYGKAPGGYCPSYMTDKYLNRVSENWDLLAPKLDFGQFTKDVGHTMTDAIEGTRGTGTIIIDILNEHQAKVYEGMTKSGKTVPTFEDLKSQLVNRLELDKTNVDEERYEMARRDAISFALGIQGSTMKLFDKIDKTLGPSDAKKVKAVLMGLFIDVGRMAQSELEMGIAESAIGKASTSAR